MLNKYIIFWIIIFIIGLLIFTGMHPLATLVVDTDTVSKKWSDFQGNPKTELIQPFNRKGFIVSYKEGMESESISIRGVIYRFNVWGTGFIEKYKYVIKYKSSAFDTWEIISQPGYQKNWIKGTNPGIKKIVIGTEKTYSLSVYDFVIVGNKQGAIRAELWVYGTPNPFNPFEKWKWVLLSSDEAYLYSGWGGLYLPIEKGKPRSTFEIGEKVRIKVKTSYGGWSVGENRNTWMVTLRYPEDRGGAVYIEKSYGDNVETYFEFIVKEEMYRRDSTNRWKIELYNSLLPKGTLLVNTIDILAKAPSDVEISPDCGETVEVNTRVTVTLSASYNPETQNPVTSFEVSVIYGTADVLLPSDPGSDLWIIPTHDIYNVEYINGKYKAVFTFTPQRTGYVTIHSKAYDSEGRASKHTKVYTILVYPRDKPAPPDEETGETYYRGGKVSQWIDWMGEKSRSPLTGEERAHINFIYLLAAIFIVSLFTLCALFLPIPLHFKTVVIFIGVLLACIIIVF